METGISSRPGGNGSDNGPSSYNAIASEALEQYSVRGEQQPQFVVWEQFNHVAAQLEGITKVLQTLTQKAPKKITSPPLSKREDGGLLRSKLLDEKSRDDEDNDITKKGK